MKRKFKHDCNSCIFLGHVNKNDLYYCKHGMGNVPTVIARYGSAPGNYKSGMSFIKLDKHLEKAAELARAKGYFIPKLPTQSPKIGES
jgi:hypothetical protein